MLRSGSLVEFIERVTLWMCDWLHLRKPHTKKNRIVIISKVILILCALYFFVVCSPHFQNYHRIGQYQDDLLNKRVKYWDLILIWYISRFSTFAAAVAAASSSSFCCGCHRSLSHVGISDKKKSFFLLLLPLQSDWLIWIGIWRVVKVASKEWRHYM